MFEWQSDGNNIGVSLNTGTEFSVKMQAEQGNITMQNGSNSQVEMQSGEELNINLGGGVSDHNQLRGRELPNQHPISAITGLQEELSNKQPKGTYLQPSALEGYATEQWVRLQGFLTQHQSLDGYATEQWVENKGYLTQHQSLDGYATEDWVQGQNFAKESQIPTVPQNVSAFNNDAGYATEQWVENKGYLTQHQSLDGYATETWVQSQGYLTQHQSLEDYATKQWVQVQGYLTSSALDGYALKTEIPTLYEWALRPNKPTYTAEEVGADASGSASQALTDAKEYTNQQIQQIPTPDVSGQISTHNNDEEAHPAIREMIPTKTSDLMNDSGFLTQHQSLDGYATEEWVQGQGYAKTSDIPTQLSQLSEDSTHRTVTDEEKTNWNNKLSQDELQDGIDDALTQAKESGEFDGYTPVKGTDYFTPADKGEIVKEVIAGLPTGTVTNAVTISTAQTVTGVKTFSASNFFDGEQKLTFGQYCPVVTDIAKNIGASMKNARAVDCQLYVAEIYAPFMGGENASEETSGLTATEGQIDFYVVTGAQAGQPTGRTLVMQMKADGLYIFGKKVLTE